MSIKRPYGVTPFWFWNDTLEPGEILRQIAEMDKAGVGGFVIHPRVGLPKSQGWMSEALLSSMKLACQEAAKRGLRVILYDEGMYPSGSSSGQVVAENPLYACRGFELREAGLAESDLKRGERLVCDCRSSQGVDFSVVDRPLRSHIRGLHYLDEEKASEETPPAADLLNPEAMECFLRLVHGRYAQALGEFFGSTITGIFTDEPSVLGRGAPKGVIPGSSGILAHLKRLTGTDFAPQMSGVFLADEPGHKELRERWEKGIRQRLEETYYSPMKTWCDQHGLELMGHPEKPDDLAVLRHFSVPGQDLVWRWVLPGPTATQGPQSTQAKVAASSAWKQGRARNSNELFGAYGHQLSLFELKWLANWALVRGQDWLIPHAYYYSLRGPRKDERPPDVGLNAVWRDQLAEINKEWETLSELVSNSDPFIHVAVLAKGDEAPWKCVEALYQHQTDFLYVEASDLLESRLNSDGQSIACLNKTFTAVVVEEGWDSELPRWILGSPLLVRAGQPGFVDELKRRAEPSIITNPAQPNLRARRGARDGRESLMLFNEGTEAISFTVASPAWLSATDLTLQPGELKLIAT